ncbi:HipA domain-containing protein [Oceanivirga salmonicida]|uniref:HipA domain-containing protein n=1 Tax=Oceanivirga salmonicida TaxID=1769291 RepID=UPI0008329913|nr:HipA domain-containing protein [Oceanivirga salmonicida]
MEIKNFDDIVKNGMSYSGNAGNKLGIYFENENWILKFPKKNIAYENTNILYTTNAISEYIGSHIYEILGYEVHKTKLGIRNNKLVVACKDFTDENIKLVELKFIYNDDLDEKELERESFKTGKTEYINILELCFIFDNNEKLNKIKGLKERFFDMLVIDAFISNNDRHLGNFGILKYKDKNTLAPIYDNGNSFFNKTEREKFQIMLNDEIKFNSILKGATIPYEFNGKQINPLVVISRLTFGKDDKNKSINEKMDNYLKKAILRNQPKIQKNIDKILKMIDEIPEQYNGIDIIYKQQKDFYKKLLKDRLEKIITPAFNELNN